MSTNGRKSMWSSPAPADQPPAMEQAQAGESAPLPPPALPAISVVQQLRVAEKKQRKRAWEKENRTMLFRGLPPVLREAIKEIAGNLQVRADDVARAFLEFGLLCYQRGELQLKPVLSNQRLTLFPKSGSSWGGKPQPGWMEKVWDCQPPVKPQKGKNSRQAAGKPWNNQTSYRGIPAEVQMAIRQLHEQCHVPLGEVATYLLGHSLEAYQSGRLVLNPQPRQVAGLTYSEE